MNHQGKGRRPGRRRIQLPSADPQDEKAFGRALAILRIIKGLSQKQAAQAAGLRPSLLCKWEAGHTIPSFATVHGILRVLGLSLVTLERVLQLVRDPTGPEPVPRALSRALEPDLAQLSEMMGKTVGEWYLGVMHRGAVLRDADLSEPPGESEAPSGPDRSHAA
ncbi:MAG TPA: helix-turn-helix transcriptional regulator [Thermoanaerobaculia bacterium]|jgi:transcriptional regulator with XRE-family HTH domain|nr:helix-turn-helix transcriptional regulator [Thermoanaerobaculia bacterium]